MAHAFLNGAAIASPSFTADLGKIPARRAPSTGVRLAPVRAEAPHVIATVTAVPISLNAPAPDFYPFTSLPPTPVFPSHAAMAQFLQSYARMLQHVQTATSGVARIDLVDRVDHSQDALVSGESLAAAGTTVLKRVRVGIRALLRHPQHGVPSGRGGAWCAKKERAEECLAELERDIEVIRSAHERPPRATTLALATIHCFDAARIIRTL
ncbi:unnamed protein product [Closterium sp. Naga37s-1]|nr:unnamed protein product [Closterium sp. Naga37s-1]